MKRVTTFAVLLVVLAALAGTAVAGPYEDGVSAYQRGDYAEAASWYRRVAEQGHAGGQFNLGLLYANGEGVPQDYAEAMKWYRLAAEQGHAGGQLNLAFMYANGQGVPQDYAEAARWYRLAAEQGDAEAQYNLGFMYGNGEGVPRGVPQDYAEGMLVSGSPTARARSPDAPRRGAPGRRPLALSAWPR